MNCEFCNKEINNKGGLVKHEKGCVKNPNRILYKSNFEGYNEKVKSGVIKGSNQFTKAKKLGLPIPEISQETRIKLGSGNRNKVHSKEYKDRHSEIMKEVVKKHPDSYTKNNIVGRVKYTNYKGTILKGSWEVLVAIWLDDHNIKWEYETKCFDYEWNGKRIYYPDFYLPELDLFIEVKGYETERDHHKWKSVSNLIVLKHKEIEKIKQGTFTL